MKHPEHAGLAAVLGLATVLAACTTLSDDEKVAADRKAAEAMVQAALDVHAAHMNSLRPARLVMGDWQYIADANTEWSHRLATALRGLEEEMMEDSPEAPWLLSSGHADESGVLFAVYNTEDRADCCPTVAVSVWLQNGKLEFRTSDGVGYVDFVDPPETMVESVMADEEQYMRSRNEEGVRKK